MTHTGPLSTADIREVLRSGVVAQGLDLPISIYSAEMALLVERGRHAMGTLSSSDAGFRDAVEHLRRCDSYAHARLPLMLGLGWRQSELIDEARLLDAEVESALLSACFNAAITIYDDLLDERPETRSASPITPDVVDGVFSDPLGAAGLLDALADGLDDPQWRIYLALMAICARRGESLRRRATDEGAWGRLGALVGRLYSTEMERGSPKKAADASLPAQIVLAVCELAAPSRLPSPREIAHSLGSVLAVVDDAVDLLDDLDAGRTNCLVPAHVEAEGWSDADLYDMVEDGLTRVSRSVAMIEAADCDGYQVSGLASFARAMVMAWTGWTTSIGTNAQDSPEATGPLDWGVAALFAAQPGGYEAGTV